MTDQQSRAPEGLEKEKFLKIIDEWKCFWMNQRQNNEADFQNYFRRAMGVDANMEHSLARMLAKHALDERASQAAALAEVREKLGAIAKRPDLPNPDRDADWKSCQKWSSAEAKDCLALLDKLGGGK